MPGGDGLMAKLLVVDDDRNINLLYEQEFTDDGHEVDLAESGPEALEMITKKDYDLVILDIGMPDMDGLEILGKIMGKKNKLPIILNTAYASYKDNFMSWSAHHYVVKSSNLEELKDKVNDVLSKRQRPNA